MTDDERIDRLAAAFDEPELRRLVSDFFRRNRAGRIFLRLAEEEGRPVVLDHLTIRTRDVDERAKEFLAMGYAFRGERIDYEDQGWWAKVFRHPRYPPFFIDQAYTDARGARSIIPAWVERFGDRVLHHVAVRVDEIEGAIDRLKAAGVEFPGAVVGAKGSRLRQIFTKAEVVDGEAFSVLELAERHGYEGFEPEQADALMRSSAL